jgi:hypothetical protein
VGLALLVVVAGCGPGVRYAYEKSGVSEDQRQRDESECRRQATVTVVGSYGTSHQAFDQGRLNRCMADRGYAVREIEAGSMPPARPSSAEY